MAMPSTISQSQINSNSLSSLNSPSNTSTEKVSILQSQPTITEADTGVLPNDTDNNNSSHQDKISNEECENDSGIENDVGSGVNNRVIVEEAKSIPIDDRTMTIVQIDQLDIMNSHCVVNDVEVASTVTVESTTNLDGSPTTVTIHKKNSSSSSPSTNVTPIIAQ